MEKIKKAILSASEDIDLSNFSFGKLLLNPNYMGYFKKNGKWFLFSTDEHNVCIIKGPFSENGIIYACALKLRISKKLQQYKFSNEEFQVYMSSNFSSIKEI